MESQLIVPNLRVHLTRIVDLLLAAAIVGVAAAILSYVSVGVTPTQLGPALGLVPVALFLSAAVFGVIAQSHVAALLVPIGTFGMLLLAYFADTVIGWRWLRIPALAVLLGAHALGIMYFISLIGVT